MSKARDLARVSPNGSGQILLPSGVAGVLPDANAPSGSVIQVVTSTTDIQTTVSSTSYQPTSLSCVINKQLSNSYILVLTSAFIMTLAGSGDATGSARIFETQSSREVFDFRIVVRSYDGGDTTAVGASMNLSCLDTQSGTGSRTYRLDLKKTSGIDTRLNLDVNGQCVSTITLLEVVA